MTMCQRPIRRVRLPSDIVLTARSLAGIGRKLATNEIGDLIDGLIDELNERGGDPDAEPDVEGELDAIEMSESPLCLR